MPPDSVLPEYRLVVIGSQDKTLLLERFFATATKFEKHAVYNDLFYVTITSNGQDCFLEIMDPGMERTGQREMSIRKAEAAILVYSASSIDSFHELAGVVGDFKRRNPNGHSLPIILIANVDKRAKNVSANIDTEQGQQLAKLLGNDCVFVETSIPTMQHGGRDIIDALIKAVNEKNPKKLKVRPSSANSTKSVKSTKSAKTDSTTKVDITTKKKPVLSTVCSIL